MRLKILVTQDHINRSQLGIEDRFKGRLVGKSPL